MSIAGGQCDIEGRPVHLNCLRNWPDDLQEVGVMFGWCQCPPGTAIYNHGVTIMLHGEARSRMSSFWAEEWMSMRISQNLDHYISSRLTNLVKPKPIWVGVPNIMFGDNMWFDIRIIVTYSPLNWLINFSKMHFSPHSWEGIHKRILVHSHNVFSNENH